MEIRDHWLFGDKVVLEETPNMGGGISPEYLVIHYTAGRSAESSVKHFKDPSVQVSAHVVIGREGGVWQVVPFNRRAWHAGESAWAGRVGMNGCSIGIELDNAGKLNRVGDKYQAWFGISYPESEVVHARHKDEHELAYWHAFTEKQIARGLEVATLLTRSYGLKDILGHDDIAPGRKVDPGPAFPMRSFRSYLFGRGGDELPQYEVTAGLLNVRRGPGTDYAIVMPPIRSGTRLSLHEMQAYWAKVMLTDGTRQEGWVRNTFIKAA
jgi:N-acetylmuramoyl-L-alanine amidase